MSTSSIKITQLSSIGANISHITIAPVVDMAGTPETKRATLQQVGNLILSNAGGTDFAPANLALIAQSVSNAAQPNITSVGTLANLSVSGNVEAGNLNGGNLISANFFSGDGGLLSNITVGNIGAVSSISNGATQINIPTVDGDIEVEGDVKLYGGLDIHSGGAPLGINDIVFFNSGLEAGRITSVGETGGAIQVQADVNFEIKVSQDDGGGGVDTAVWTFGSDGKLALPADGDIVDSNGNSVLGGGGSADTGDITFVGTTISTAEDEQRIQVETRDDNGEWNTRITMDPDDVYIRMEVRNDNKVSRIDLDQVDNERITIEGRDIDMVVDIDEDIDIHSGDDIDITADDRMRMTGERVRIRSNSSEDTVEIVTDNNDTQQTWAFKPDGSLTLPGNGNYTISESEPGLIFSSNFGVAIVTDAAEAGKAFIFGTDGELTLPSGGIIREGMMGTNQTVDIIPGDSELEDQRLIIKGGFLPGQEPHIHLTIGDLTEGSIFLGTDEHNVRTMTNGGMSISAYNYGGEISKTWEFGADGELTLPGALIQSTNTATDTGEPVALDITKSVHKLADGDYTLADGAEGQIIYLVPQTGATHEGVELFVANARVMTNSHTSQIVNDNLFLPFSNSTTGSLTNVVTLIFTDGAWNLSGGEWD